MKKTLAVYEKFKLFIKQNYLIVSTVKKEQIVKSEDCNNKNRKKALFYKTLLCNKKKSRLFKG